MRYKFRVISHEAEHTTITPADYTILMKGAPVDENDT